MDQRTKTLSAAFGIKSIGEWTQVLPSTIEARPGIGRKSLDHLRLYLANQGLTLRDDRTPDYWQKILSAQGMQSAIACPFTILVDSQEKHPFTFVGFRSGAATNNRPIDVTTKIKGLGPSHGDYSLEGYEGQIHIERKSLEDAQGTILGWGEHRERFARTLEFLESIEFGAVIVECSLGEMLAKSPSRGRKSAEENRLIMNQQYLAWLLKFRAVKWIFCDTRRLAETETFRLFEKFYAYKLRTRKQSEKKSNTIPELASL